MAERNSQHRRCINPRPGWTYVQNFVPGSTVRVCWRPRVRFANPRSRATPHNLKGRHVQLPDRLEIARDPRDLIQGVLAASGLSRRAACRSPWKRQSHLGQALLIEGVPRTVAISASPNPRSLSRCYTQAAGGEPAQDAGGDIDDLPGVALILLGRAHLRHSRERRRENVSPGSS